MDVRCTSLHPDRGGWPNGQEVPHFVHNVIANYVSKGRQHAGKVQEAQVAIADACRADSCVAEDIIEVMLKYVPAEAVV